MQKLRSSRAFRAFWSKLRAIQDKRSGLLIAICCLTLAILGSLQLSSIERVNRAQHEQALVAAQSSLRVLNRSLRREVSHLLTVFRAEPRWDPAERAQRLAERYFVWHESSANGPAIHRILLYDALSPTPSRLQQLKLPQSRLEPVDSGQSYKDLGVRLQSTVSRHREKMDPQWLSTWLYYPEFSALVRPVGTLRKKLGNGQPEMSFVGYLVLQLDLEYISRHILPRQLGIHLSSLRDDLQVDVAFVVDGHVTHLFRLEEVAVPARANAIKSTSRYRYALAADGHRLGALWAESADPRRRILLTGTSVPRLVARVGGVQRVALRSVSPNPALIEFARYRPNRKRSLGGRVGEVRMLPLTPERPRVFLVAGRPRRLEVALRHADGSLEDALAAQGRRILALGTGLFLLVGAAMALVVVSLRRASHLAKVRLEFAAAVSHELRTPVAAIRAMGDNIAHGILGSGKQALRYGELIRDEARRLSEMTEQTLNFVALDAGSERYEVVPLDVSAVLDEAVAYAQPIAERAGFVLERADGADIAPVLADETALRQSLRNLLSNAVKYGLPGRWVKLESTTASKSERHEVAISVHDRGPGIPANEQRSIFEPYYRAVGPNNSNVPGSGLGLNLAKRMVHGMGGRLTLRSVPGKGSVFTIHLPVAG